MFDLIIIFIIILIFIQNIVEISSVVFRLLGSLNQTAMIGQHVSVTIMLLNRVAAAFLLLFLGFMVDLGGKGFYLSFSYFLAAGLMTLFLFKISVSGRFFYHMFSLTIKLIHKDITVRSIEDFYKNRPKFNFKLSIDFHTIFVGFVYYVGFLLPSIFASLYPEFRATLMQSAFLLNGIASVVSVMTIEKRMASVAESQNEFDIHQIILEFTISRAIGFLLAALLFLLICLTAL